MIRALFLTSRPLSWVNTAFPFAAAYLVTTREVDATLIVGTLFFLVPYNVAMYGINDVFDYASDLRNPRKGGVEGALLGVPSIAVSLQFTRETFDFGPASSAAAHYARAVLERGLPPRTLLNINVPTGPARGYRVTVQGKRNHVTSVMDVVDPRRRVWYWIEEGQNDWEPHDRSDYQAVKDGFISVTPLHPDLTHYAALEAVESLRMESEVEVK